MIFVFWFVFPMANTYLYVFIPCVINAVPIQIIIPVVALEHEQEQDKGFLSEEEMYYNAWPA